ncbi:MAG TPA: hypothetical protein VKQ29_05855 [Aliidongia sp.]|nr:hypothetical protein [Aliidongia sp.]
MIRLARVAVATGVLVASLSVAAPPSPAEEPKAAQARDTAAFAIAVTKAFPFCSASISQPIRLQSIDPDALPSIGNLVHRGGNQLVEGAQTKIERASDGGGVTLTISGLPSGSFELPISVAGTPGPAGDIMVHIDVKDGAFVPFVTILLGVLASAGLRDATARYIPRQQLLRSALPLRAELERWSGDAADEKEAMSLATTLADLAALIAGTSGDGDGKKELARIGAIVKKTREARAKRSTALRERLVKARASLAEIEGQAGDHIAQDLRHGVDAAIARAELMQSADKLTGMAEAAAVAERLIGQIAEDWYGAIIQEIETALGENATAQQKRILADAKRLLAGHKPREANEKLQPLQAAVTGMGDDGRALQALLRRPAGRAPAQTIDVFPAQGIRAGTPAHFRLPLTLPTGATVAWSFADGTAPELGKSENHIAHSFRDAGSFDVEALVTLRDDTFKEFGVHIDVAADPADAAANTAGRNRERAEWAVWLTTAVLASASGLTLLYIGKPFGQFSDYLAVFLWGAGTNHAIAGARSKKGPAAGG